MSCESSESISLKKNNKTHETSPVDEFNFSSAGFFFAGGFTYTINRDAVRSGYLELWRAPRAVSMGHFTAGCAPLRALARGYDCFALCAMSLPRL
jgi:hypothetical protein